MKRCQEEKTEIMTKEDLVNKLEKMHGVTRLDLRCSGVNPAKHLYVTVSKMHCTSNEAEEVLKMLQSQKWFEWTFNFVF